MHRYLRRRSLLLCGLMMLMMVSLAAAEEFTALTQSTVIGRSYGIPPATNAGEVEILAETAFFFKNLELFNLDFVLGETVTGYRVPLRLRYQARGDVSVEFGVNLGRDYGDIVSLNHVAPLVRLTYWPAADLAVVAGNIYPTHWLADAILDDMWQYRGDNEEGFQLRGAWDSFKSDSWLDWRKREGAVEAEEFEIGMTHEVRLWRDWVRFDAQGLWSHAGGQISTSTRVEQDLVYGLGFSVGTKHPWGSRVFEGWRLGGNWLTSGYEDQRTPFEQTHGRSWTGHADFRLRPHFMARVFSEVYRGTDFNAVRGDPLYRLDRYSQLGVNLVFNVGDDDLSIDAGFVSQWTGVETNLTYQLYMVWQTDVRLISMATETSSRMGGRY